MSPGRPATRATRHVTAAGGCERESPTKPVPRRVPTLDTPAPITIEADAAEARRATGLHSNHAHMARTPPTPQPAELCGYAVVETLAPARPTSRSAPAGGASSLKRLDPDCLHAPLLHPDVRDRLSRVRELAHAGVANLFGVGKDGATTPGSIWEYVEGKPFAAYASEHCRSPRELAVLVRELVLTVESLHVQGIVHGAIHGGNVIVAPGGARPAHARQPAALHRPRRRRRGDRGDGRRDPRRARRTRRPARRGCWPKRARRRCRCARWPRGWRRSPTRASDAPPPAAAVGAARSGGRAGGRCSAPSSSRCARRRRVAYGVWHAAGRAGRASRLPAWLTSRLRIDRRVAISPHELRHPLSRPRPRRAAEPPPGDRAQRRRGQHHRRRTAAR